MRQQVIYCTAKYPFDKKVADENELILYDMALLVLHDGVRPGDVCPHCGTKTKREASMRELESLARQARSDLERWRVDVRLLKRLYQEYNPTVEDLATFIDRSQQMFPTLNCGVATVYLRHVLRGGDVIQGKYREHDHTFLMLKGQTIVDITADQYGGPAVYVGPVREPWSVKR